MGWGWLVCGFDRIVLYNWTSFAFSCKKKVDANVLCTFLNLLVSFWAPCFILDGGVLKRSLMSTLPIRIYAGLVLGKKCSVMLLVGSELTQ